MFHRILNLAATYARQPSSGARKTSMAVVHKAQDNRPSRQPRNERVGGSYEGNPHHACHHDCEDWRLLSFIVSFVPRCHDA